MKFIVVFNILSFKTVIFALQLVEILVKDEANMKTEKPVGLNFFICID